MRVVVVVALLCRVAYATPPGMADEEPPAPSRPGAPPPAAPDEPRVASYRAQTLLADALAGALMFAAINSRDDDRAEALAKLGGSTYVLGAPIVHLSKNRGKRALASVTMRIGFPILGAVVGDSMKASSTCAAYYGCADDAPSGELVLGALVGALAASAVDSLYLAKGDPAPPAHTAWTPTARISQTGVALGIRGSF